MERDWEAEDRAKRVWHPTPRWAFWRPAWRKLDPGGWGDGDVWMYQTNRQRACEALEERYANSDTA